MSYVTITRVFCVGTWVEEDRPLVIFVPWVKLGRDFDKCDTRFTATRLSVVQWDLRKILWYSYLPRAL